MAGGCFQPASLRPVAWRWKWWHGLCARTASVPERPLLADCARTVEKLLAPHAVEQSRQISTTS